MHEQAGGALGAHSLVLIIIMWADRPVARMELSWVKVMQMISAVCPCKHKPTAERASTHGGKGETKARACECEAHADRCGYSNPTSCTCSHSHKMPSPALPDCPSTAPLRFFPALLYSLKQDLKGRPFGVVSHVPQARRAIHAAGGQQRALVVKAQAHNFRLVAPQRRQALARLRIPHLRQTSAHTDTKRD